MADESDMEPENLSERPVSVKSEKSSKTTRTSSQFSETSTKCQSETEPARSSEDESKTMQVAVPVSKQLSIDSVAENEELFKLETDQPIDGAVKEYPLELGYADFGLCLMSALLFILDYVINLFIFQKYFQILKENDPEDSQFVLYFYIIIVITLAPPLVTALFEVVWYMEEKIKYGKALKWYQWIIRLILMVLLLGPAFRYIEVLEHAHKVTKTDDRREKQKIVKKSLQMKEDADFLYMLEKFTESGLHLVMQMFIVKTELAKDEHEDIGAGEALKIIMAVMMMPYTVTIYIRSQRQADEKANNMDVAAAVIQFIWRMFIIIPQAICLSFFLAMFPFPFMFVSVGTWALMAIWVFIQGTDFCRGRMWLECIFRFFVAFVYLFTFFNVSKGETYYKALFYYSFMFLERGLMMCFWCQADMEANWYRWPSLVTFFLFFSTGIAIQLLYYGFHHPTKPTPNNLHKKLFAIGSKPKKNGKSKQKAEVETEA